MFRSPQEMHTFIQIVENITNADTSLIGNEPQIEPTRTIKDSLIKMTALHTDEFDGDKSQNGFVEPRNIEAELMNKKLVAARKL